MSYVAFQYAEALFALAQEEKQLTQVQEVYNQFLSGLDNEILSFLTHPKVSNKDKKEIIGSVVDNTIFRHFLFVLIDNGRIDYVEDCYQELMTIINNQNQVMDVVVYSPKKLTQEELNQLTKNIGTKHNRTVQLENVVDPKILGGIRIEYEGHVLDQTINSFLNSLKNDLSK